MLSQTHSDPPLPLMLTHPHLAKGVMEAWANTEPSQGPRDRESRAQSHSTHSSQLQLKHPIPGQVSQGLPSTSTVPPTPEVTVQKQSLGYTSTDHWAKTRAHLKDSGREKQVKSSVALQDLRQQTLKGKKSSGLPCAENSQSLGLGRGS